MKEKDILRIDLHDVSYPHSIKSIMGKNAPKVLYALGNLSLLEEQGIGFCGSRKSSPKGLETAKDCSEQAADNGVVVVSGNATGIDFQAHYNALKYGGKTIFVLPEGINHFSIKKAFHDVWDWERVLILSGFEPDAPWMAYRAMARNQLIIALSRVMIVIEAGEKGGTMNAGLETLRKKIPLFVAEYEDMTSDAKGNQFLINHGGHPLLKKRGTGKANMTPIMECIKNKNCQHFLPQDKQACLI